MGIRGPIGSEGPTGSTVYSDDTTLILDYQTAIPEGNLSPINFNAAYPGGMLDTWSNLQNQFSWFEFMFYTDYYQYNTIVVRSTDLQVANGFTAFEISKVVGHIYFWVPVSGGLSSKIAIYQPEGADIVRLKIWGFGTGQGPQGDPGPMGATGPIGPNIASTDFIAEGITNLYFHPESAITAIQNAGTITFVSNQSILLTHGSTGFGINFTIQEIGLSDMVIQAAGSTNNLILQSINNNVDNLIANGPP
jgi:hypothetical protein